MLSYCRQIFLRLIGLVAGKIFLVVIGRELFGPSPYPLGILDLSMIDIEQGNIRLNGEDIYAMKPEALR